MLYEVLVPEGARTGDILDVVANGKEYTIEVPEGAEPGMALVFESRPKRADAAAPPSAAADGGGVPREMEVPTASLYQLSITSVTTRDRSSTATALASTKVSHSL